MQVFAAGGQRFAYCSTLAIYIYRLRGYSLDKILVGHDKMITGLGWSPHDARLLCSCSSDQARVPLRVHDESVRRPSLN